MEKNHTVCIAHCYNEYRPAAFQYRRHGYHRKNSAENGSLAAVGTNGEIVAMLVSLSAGLSIGANVLISRYIGAEKKKISYRCYFSMMTALIFGIVLAVCWLFHSFAIIKVD